MKKESVFKRQLKEKLYDLFPDCYIFENDPIQLQGIPDILILWNNKWAMLETKREHRSSHRPNQDYYIDLFNDMSFAAFIYPENEEEILYELQRALRFRRPTRVS